MILSACYQCAIIKMWHLPLSRVSRHTELSFTLHADTPLVPFKSRPTRFGVKIWPLLLQSLGAVRAVQQPSASGRSSRSQMAMPTAHHTLT